MKSFVRIAITFTVLIAAILSAVPISRADDPAPTATPDATTPAPAVNETGPTPPADEPIVTPAPEEVQPQSGDGLDSIDAFVTAVATGDEHTCALTSSGGVKCWGRNNYGQLGDGTTTDHPTAVNVSGLTSGVTAITAGEWHTCALTSGGGIKCWGRNVYGQLGDGTTTQRTTPVNVSGLTSGVTAIGAGYRHTCALTSGGVKCWGLNVYGQLGDDTTTQRSTPVNVSGLTSGVTRIGGGWAHTCALTSGGGVKCWGYNSSGQLGDNSESNRPAPVNVSGLTSGVTAIAVGRDHTCAVASGGAAKCWGNNLLGAVGNGGTPFEVLTPANVTGLSSGVTSMTGGHNFTCARTSSGAAKCWGVSNWGQLGDGLETNSDTPVNVAGLSSGVAALSAGANHVCARMNSGAVMCWGYNAYGRLGDGTTTDRSTPVFALISDIRKVFLPAIRR